MTSDENFTDILKIILSKVVVTCIYTFRHRGIIKEIYLDVCPIFNTSNIILKVSSQQMYVTKILTQTIKAVLIVVNDV